MKPTDLPKLVVAVAPLTSDQLARIGPVARGIANQFAHPLNNAMARFGITSKESRAVFLAQVLHESGNLSCLVESLNYSAERLLTVSGFRGKFTPAQANHYGRTDAHKADQEGIACIAYAYRNGNGGPVSRDGWRFRGRGPIQITGRANYAACGTALGLDLLKNPELLEQPEAGCLSAAWFWDQGNRTGRSLNLLADQGKLTAVRAAVNGADNGLMECLNIARRAAQELV
jgi:putative chitinase